MNQQDFKQSSGIADEIKEQKVKFKNMTFKNKLIYIYDYYKWPIIIAVIVLLIVGSMLKQSLTRKNDILYAAFLNSSSLTNEADILESDYYETYEVDTKKDQVVLDTSMSIKEGINDQISMASASKLLVLLSTEVLDCMVCEPFVVDFYAEDGAYKNLEEFLPPELYKSLEEKDLLYEAEDENGNMVPTGIDMTGCSKLIQNKIYEANKPIYMVFSRTAPHKEQAINFFKMLLGE